MTIKKHNPLSVPAFTFLIFLSTGFVSNPLFAADVKKVSEASIVLPWTFIEDIMKNGKQLEGQQSLGAMSFQTQGVPLRIENIMLDYKAQLAPVTSHDNETFFNAENLLLKLHINAFSVEKDITQMVNGMLATVHLKADCQPFSLTQNQAVLKTQWKWITQNTNVKGELESFDLSWPIESWKIDPIICTGPKGFADIVADEIKTTLSKNEDINKLMRPLFEKTMNEKIESTLVGLRGLKTLPINLTKKNLDVQLSGVETVSGKGIHLKAFVRSSLQDTSPMTQSDVTTLLEETPELLQAVGDHPVLIIGQQSLTDLIQDMSVGESVKTNMNQVAGFQSLLQSRFKQFFAWRDLRNYPKSARFDLISETTKPLSIKFTTKEKLNVIGYVDSGVYANRAGQNWRSVEIKTSFSGTAQFSIQSGVLGLTFTGQKVNSTSRFAPAYAQRFDPPKKVSIKYLDQALQQSPYFKGMKWALPELTISSDLKVKAMKITRQSPKHFFIEFQKTP